MIPVKAIQRVMSELEEEQAKVDGSQYGNGYWYGADYAIEKLREVIAQYAPSDTRDGSQRESHVREQGDAVQG